MLAAGHHLTRRLPCAADCAGARPSPHRRQPTPKANTPLDLAYYTGYPWRMTIATDLRPSAFFLADHAVVESGKLYVNGGFFDRLHFPSFPAVTTFSVVAVLFVPWRAHHQLHKFSIFFADADGQRLQGEFQGDFQLGSPPDMRAGDSSVLPLAATVGGFLVPRAGEYSAIMEVDGTEVAKWAFKAIQVFRAAPGTAHDDS